MSLKFFPQRQARPAQRPVVMVGPVCWLAFLAEWVGPVRQAAVLAVAQVGMARQAAALAVAPVETAGVLPPAAPFAV
jgi:hypothetical protein